VLTTLAFAFEEPLVLFFLEADALSQFLLLSHELSVKDSFLFLEEEEEVEDDDFEPDELPWELEDLVGPLS
jgi:hypothetical protein